MLIQKLRQELCVQWLYGILTSNSINFDLHTFFTICPFTCPNSMGGKIKYFTFEERIAAARRHRASYAQSERGKIVRQVQNAHAYAIRHGRHGPRTTSKDLCNPLPSSVLQFTSLPLPTSHLFHQSLTDPDLIDDSDLSQWDKAPPYKSLPPPDSPEEQRFTQNLFDVLLGRHLHMERESRAHRAAMYNAGERFRVLKELCDALERLIEGWDDLNACVTDHLQCIILYYSTLNHIGTLVMQEWRAIARNQATSLIISYQMQH
ncbi:hypothetical protein BDR06DRAFT_968206 [Suillus hirtellus]|nr:hypothetical protein BDR06DRAFT_968206 [Suillus hirtellus]